MRRRLVGAALLAVLVTMSSAACGGASGGGSSGGDTPAATASAQRFPDVTEVTVERTGDTYSFDVTISSPYDTPERYADGWRVKNEDGTVYGKHTLGHDHADEQPFTRTQTGVRIPDGVEKVVVEARDKSNGYGGDTKTVTLPD